MTENLFKFIAVVLPPLCLASAAMAKCTSSGPSVMYLGKSERYTLLLTTTPGELCPIFFDAQGAQVQFTSGEVSVGPSIGKLTPAGQLHFAYLAPDSVGRDHFALKICGTDSAGTGCNILDYDVDVR